MAIVNYHCAKGRLIGEDTNGIRTDYMTDALGSVTGTVNSSQAVVNTYRYKPFGELLAKTGSGADPKFMWNGGTQSRRTGIAYSVRYNRARHYGTRQGQWTTVDPLWPGERAYGYSEARPTTFFDPSGLMMSQFSCKGCEPSYEVKPGPGGTTGVVVGVPKPGSKGTPVLSGAECQKLAQKYFPGRNCHCVNGGFFYRGQPMGPLDAVNCDRVNGIDPPGVKDVSFPLPVVAAGNNGFVTGLIGTPPSPLPSPDPDKGSPGRTAACVSIPSLEVMAIYVTTGCGAADFFNCITSRCNGMIIWLDGGGSSQIHPPAGKGKPIYGNASSTGEPDERNVDNWFVICDGVQK